MKSKAEKPENEASENERIGNDRIRAPHKRKLREGASEAGRP